MSKKQPKAKACTVPASPSLSPRLRDFGLNKLTFASDSKKPKQTHFSESLAQQLSSPGDTGVTSARTIFHVVWMD